MKTLTYVKNARGGKKFSGKRNLNEHLMNMVTGTIVDVISGGKYAVIL